MCLCHTRGLVAQFTCPIVVPSSLQVSHGLLASPALQGHSTPGLQPSIVTPVSAVPISMSPALAPQGEWGQTAMGRCDKRMQALQGR